MRRPQARGKAEAEVAKRRKAAGAHRGAEELRRAVMAAQMPEKRPRRKLSFKPLISRFASEEFDSPLKCVRAKQTGLKRTRAAEREAYTRCKTARQADLRVMLAGPKRGEQWEKVGNWTPGEKRGRVSGVLSA
eukprot:22426-Prorocentrum_minimum.AAC.1